jgi:opacity protein-like surface antigen
MARDFIRNSGRTDKMSRLGTIVCAVLFVVTPMLVVPASPVQADASWTVGPRGGITFSQLTGSDKNKILLFATPPIDGNLDGTRTGFTLGAFGEVSFSENIAIQIEGMYTQKGGEGTNDSTGVTVPIKIDYIEFPVLFVFKIPVNDKWSINGLAGPYIAFTTSAKAGDVDIKSSIKSTDFGSYIGLGAEVEVADGKSIEFDGRWGFGWTSMDDSGNSYTIRNSTIVISAGFGFDIFRDEVPGGMGK